MSEPLEIIAAPFTVWVAPVGTAFPFVNVAPLAPWVLLGTRGNLNYSEDGVTVTHEEEIEEFRMLGATGPITARRVSEGCVIGLTLHDLTIDQYTAILENQTIVTTAAAAGRGGDRAVGLTRGATVRTRSLLVRGPSPLGVGFNMQYEVPRGYFRSEAEVVFQKGEPAGLELQFVSLVDLTAGEHMQFGRLRQQHTAPI